MTHVKTLYGAVEMPQQGYGSETLSPLTSGDDLNDLTRAGWYAADSAVANLPDAAQYTILHMPGYDASEANQIALAIASNHVCYRRKDAASWQAWVNVFDQSNDIVADNVTISDFLYLPRQANRVFIASGAITVTGSHMMVDTEASAGTDDLDTINGGTDGMILVLQSFNNSRTVVVKHGTGNIALQVDHYVEPPVREFTMDNALDRLTLVYDSRLNTWCELSRSSNGV